MIAGPAGKLLLLAVSLGAALTAGDALIRATDLGFRPLRSPANADTIVAASEFRTRVRTNALGFREPRLPGPKPPGTRRIVVLGDSFTHGYGVEEDEAYPRVLEGLLPGVEVINLGVPATCPLDYAANFEEVGRAYEPDLVLVGLMANDIHDVLYLRERGARLLSALLHQVQDGLAEPRPLWKRLPSLFWPDLHALASRAVRGPGGGSAAAAREPREGSAPSAPRLPRERWKAVLRELTARYGNTDEVERRLPTLPAERLDRIQTVLTVGRESDEDQAMYELSALLEPRDYIDRLTLPPRYAAAWEEITNLLARIAATARRGGAETMVVYVPSAHEVVPARLERLAGFGFEVDETLLTQGALAVHAQRFGAQAGIPVVDLTGPLRAHADENLYFRYDAHWTPRGHRVAAEAIAAAVARHPGS